MAKPGIVQVTTSDNFQTWLDKTNELVTLVNTDIMTASVLGDTTIGNATLQGSFTANTVNVVGTLSANTAGIVSLRHKDTVTSEISTISPVRILSNIENILTIETPAELKPQLRLINGSNIRWMISHDNSSTSSSFVIKTENAASPQVSITQTGRINATQFGGDGSLLTNIQGDSITSIDATKITSGTLDIERIPDFDASKITTGVFSNDRLPATATRGEISLLDLQNQTSSTQGFITGRRFRESLTWDNIANKPTTFTPSSHTHNLSEISDLGTLTQTQWNTGISEVEAVISPKKLAGAIAVQGVPTGAVFYMPVTSPPAGYLHCNGEAVSRTTYAALFALIGTIYGAGNGSTTFNLPDLRAEFIRGWDGGRNVDLNRTIGSSQAALAGTVPSTGWGTFGRSPGTISSGRLVVGSGNAEGVETLESLRAAGSSGRAVTPGDTRPRNVALMAVIKT